MDHQLLLATFYEVDDLYKELVQQGVMNVHLLDSIPSECKRIWLKQSQLPRDKVIALLAHVMAFWTLSDLKSEDRKDKAWSNKDNFLTKPHLGQVFCIIRLLGIDSEAINKPRIWSEHVEDFFSGRAKHIPFTLDNQFVQLGEGKSVVLGITSTVLALMGYDVDCACYSEHLSKRDYHSFESLFSKFGLINNIRYSTFSKIAEAFLNNKGNIRQSIAATLETNPRSLIIVGGQSSQDEHRSRVIIIDEVDVFFSPTFYGKPYNPKTLLKGYEIFALTSSIWEYLNPRQEIVAKDTVQLQLEDIKLFPEYAACCGPTVFLVSV
jgi:hypothetical protein